VKACAQSSLFVFAVLLAIAFSLAAVAVRSW